MKKRVLWASTGLCLLAGPAALACGISTHVEVSQRAIHPFDRGTWPDYADALLKYPEALQGGSSFPDWGYALPNFGDAAEEAHWDPFLQAAATYVYETYPKPWGQDAWRLAVFLFACASHSVADITFHGLGVDEGFIEAMAGLEQGGDYGAAHDISDVGGDMVVAYELDQSYMVARWYVPTSDMLQVYHSLGYEDVTAQALTLGNFLLFVGGHAEKMAGQLLYPYYARQSVFLAESFQDYFQGGLDEMSVSTAWKWEEMINWMEGGLADGGRALGAVDAEAGVQAAVLAGLDALEQGALCASVRREGSGVMFELEQAPCTRLGKTTDAQGDWQVALAKSLEPDAFSGAPAGIERRQGGAAARSETTAALTVEEKGFTLSVPYSRLGSAMAVGDFNGDGKDDVAMGAPGWGGGGMGARGLVSLYYGGASLPTVSLDVASETQNLTGTEDAGRFGWALAALDFNADGRQDLAVSMPTAGAAQGQFRGKVLVFFGAHYGLPSVPNLIITGEADFTNLGMALAAGDANGDGRADLLIGSPYARGGGVQRGSVAVFLSSTARLAATTLGLSQADLLLTGGEDWGWFGMSLGMVPLADGRRLLVVGAPAADGSRGASSGKLYGYGLKFPLTSAPAPTFVLTGETASEQLGHSLTVGDPAGTGYPVLAVSAPSREGSGEAQAGTVVILRLDDIYGELSLDAVPAQTLLEGSTALARFGRTVRFADLDRDGKDELLVAAPWTKGQAGVESGLTWWWKGGSLPVGTIRKAELTASGSLEGSELYQRLGSALVAADLNGDGVRELLSGARNAYAAGRQGGAVWLTTWAELQSSGRQGRPVAARGTGPQLVSARVRGR